MQHDWGRLVREILASGLTQRELGARLMLGQSTISKLAAGEYVGDPAWTVGQAILRVHRRRCRNVELTGTKQRAGKPE